VLETPQPLVLSHNHLQRLSELPNSPSYPRTRRQHCCSTINQASKSTVNSLCHISMHVIYKVHTRYSKITIYSSTSLTNTPHYMRQSHLRFQSLRCNPLRQRVIISKYTQNSIPLRLHHSLPVAKAPKKFLLITSMNLSLILLCIRLPNE